MGYFLSLLTPWDSTAGRISLDDPRWLSKSDMISAAFHMIFYVILEVFAGNLEGKCRSGRESRKVGEILTSKLKACMLGRHWSWFEWLNDYVG